jgi:uncharacterized membrane protein
MKENRKLDLFHVSFEVALILKAINGLFEIIGGILLTFLNQSNLNHIIVTLTQGELSEDPNDVFASTLLHFSERFSISAQHFGMFYLISHGIIKVILVVLLWRKKLWAYPLSILLLGLFISYQIYGYAIGHSVMMILLTVLDLVVILLTIIDYRKQKQNLQPN